MKMMSLKLKILIGFAIAVIGFGYCLLKTRLTSLAVLNESHINARQLKVMKSIEEIENDVEIIETSYRGYLISGDTTFKLPYKDAINKLEKSIIDLKRISPLFESQQPYFPHLFTLIDNKIMFAEKLIALKNENNTIAYKQLFETKEGQLIMDSIRNEVGILERIGEVELNRSEARENELAQSTLIIFTILTLLIACLLILLYFIINNDINKTTKAQKIIDSANKEIKELYDYGPCGYLSTDENLSILSMNKTGLKILGYSESEIINKKSLTDFLIEPFSFDRNPANLLNRELKFRCKSNKQINVILDYNKREVAGGTIYQFAIKDITERKHSEHRINYLAELINQSNDAIISIDNEFKIVSWNKGAERLYGYEEKEVMHLLAREVLKPDHSEETVNAIRKELVEKGFWSGETTQYKKSGEPITILVSVSFIQNELGERIGYVFINQDFTAQKKYENQLQKFNVELLQQVKQKTEEVTDTLERLTDAFFAMDSAYTITFMNSKAKEIMTKSSETKEPLNLYDLYPELPNSEFDIACKKSFETQDPVELEVQEKATGRWYYNRIYPSPNGFSVFFQDISTRHANERNIIESEMKYKLLFENNPFPMWVLDSDTLQIIDVNQTAVEQYNYSHAEFLTLNFMQLISTDDKEQIHAYRNKFNAMHFTGVLPHRRKDKSELIMEVFFYTIKTEGKDRKIVVANDVTNLMAYQEELKNSRDELRQLSVYMENIRENERTNIAREIHDELGQQLTGLKMDVSWISKKIGDDVSVRNRVNTMLVLIDDTVKTIRRIASDLRPSILDDLGLIAAIKWQSQEFEKRTGIRCKFVSHFKDENLEKSIATGIFRIYQEALTNVARHAHASEVNTILYRENGYYKLSIQDNGIGMSPDALSKKTLGLIGMNERALMIGGKLNFSSESGEGTLLELEIPKVQTKYSKRLI